MSDPGEPHVVWRTGPALAQRVVREGVLQVDRGRSGSPGTAARRCRTRSSPHAPQGAPPLRAAGGWPPAFGVLALGTAAGIAAMLRLRSLRGAG